MVIDLPSTLVIIGIGGFVTSKTYVYISNSQYNAINGEKLVFKSLLYGSLNTIFFSFFISLTKYRFLSKDDQSIDFRNLAITLFVYLIVCGLMGCLLAQLSPKFNKINMKLREELMGKIPPKHSNILEGELIKLAPEEIFDSHTTTRKLGFFELRNQKIYIGIVINYDLNDNMPLAERFITLIPILSGKRVEISGEVKLNLDYILKHVELIIQKNENLDDKEIIKKAVLTIKPITFSQCDIFVVREFDYEIANAFDIMQKNP
jgi:hypothetical protein